MIYRLQFNLNHFYLKEANDNLILFYFFYIIKRCTTAAAERSWRCLPKDMERGWKQPKNSSGING